MADGYSASVSDLPSSTNSSLYACAGLVITGAAFFGLAVLSAICTNSVKASYYCGYGGTFFAALGAIACKLWTASVESSTKGNQHLERLKRRV